MSNSQYEIFVSYAREDTSVARRLSASWQELGWSVWIDDRLDIGSSFDSEITRVLEDARCVVVLWSRYSVRSAWVLKEARIGHSRGILVPVMLDGAEIPKPFSELNSALLRGWQGSRSDFDYERLCSALADRIGAKSSEAQKLVARVRRRMDKLAQGASRWSDLAVPIQDKTDIAWPWWMVRYIVANTTSAYWDLFWSVGGSPPYGGISYDEAAAVYELVEKYRGPGRASEASYARVERFLSTRPIATRALEAFRKADKIQSDPENFEESDLYIGAVEAIDDIDEPLSAFFRLLTSQIRYNEKDFEAAYKMAIPAVGSLSRFYETDPEYGRRLSQGLVNSSTFAMLNGDFDVARKCAERLEQIGEADLYDMVPEILRQEASLPSSYAELVDLGHSHLEQQPLKSLECFLEAERIAVAERLDNELAGLRGDIAVTYRRIGNNKKAIFYNREAIEASQRVNNLLNVTRWSQNLAGILARQYNRETALPYARTAIYAAAELVDPTQFLLSSQIFIPLLDDDDESRQTGIDVLRAARELADDASKRDHSKMILERIDELIKNLESTGAADQLSPDSGS